MHIPQRNYTAVSAESLSSDQHEKDLGLFRVDLFFEKDPSQPSLNTPQPQGETLVENLLPQSAEGELTFDEILEVVIRFSVPENYRDENPQSQTPTDSTYSANSFIPIPQENQNFSNLSTSVSGPSQRSFEPQGFSYKKFQILLSLEVQFFQKK